jgi:hypothetical protein
MPGAPSEDNCHPWIYGKLMVSYLLLLYYRLLQRDSADSIVDAQWRGELIRSK